MTRVVPVLVLLAVPGAAPAAEVEVGYRHELLTRGPDWRELSIEAGWRAPGHAGLELAVRGLERFGLRDINLRASGSAPLGPRWTVAGEASASPEHRFVPAFSGGASLQRTLGGGFVGSGGVRWSRYESEAGITDAGVGSLGLERYWGAFRLGWTGYLATLDGEWSASNAVAWDLYYRDRDRAGVVVAAGREIESTGGRAPVVSTVLAAALRGRHGLGGGWALTYEAGIQRQGDLYTRGGARIGLGRHF